NGAYSAGVGYDMVTGIGSPNLANLIAGLEAGPPGLSVSVPSKLPRARLPTARPRSRSPPLPQAAPPDSSGISTERRSQGRSVPPSLYPQTPPTRAYTPSPSRTPTGRPRRRPAS